VKCDRSGSGSPDTSLSNVSCVQCAYPRSGCFFFTTFFRLGAGGRLLLQPLVLHHVRRGACTHTCPRSSNPLRPARPAIWANSRFDNRRTPVPSYLQSWVNSTERIGTFTPTPSVSVPQMIFRRPSCASFSTSSRYFGSSPAWWTPTPAVMNLRRSLPMGESKRKSPIASRTAAFSVFDRGSSAR
jgi:hypothetical protein